MDSHITAHVHKHKSNNSRVEDFLIVEIRCNGFEIGHIASSDDIECIPNTKGWIISARTTKPISGFTTGEMYVEQLYIDDERMPYDAGKMVFNAEDFL